jgi:hypothetical protein
MTFNALGYLAQQQQQQMAQPLPNPFAGLAEAAQGGLSAYMQADQMRRQREQQEHARALEQFNLQRQLGKDALAAGDEAGARQYLAQLQPTATKLGLPLSDNLQGAFGYAPKPWEVNEGQTLVDPVTRQAIFTAERTAKPLDPVTEAYKEALTKLTLTKNQLAPITVQIQQQNADAHTTSANRPRGGKGSSKGDDPYEVEIKIDRAANAYASRAKAKYTKRDRRGRTTFDEAAWEADVSNYRNNLAQRAGLDQAAPTPAPVVPSPTPSRQPAPRPTPQQKSAAAASTQPAAPGWWETLKSAMPELQQPTFNPAFQTPANRNRLTPKPSPSTAANAITQRPKRVRLADD